MRQVLWAFPVLLLMACSVVPAPAADGGDSACRMFYEATHRAVRREGVADSGATRIDGFPYLRVDRFLASFRHEVADERRFSDWVDRLADRDRTARRSELAALSEGARQRLSALAPAGAGLVEAADLCRQRLRQADLETPSGRERLIAAAQVPDDYVTAWRILGLYPLTALFVSAGIDRWHREARETFALPLLRLPTEGEYVLWEPPPAPAAGAAEVSAILAGSSDGPLGIPEPSEAQRRRLFSIFAPAWLIDTAGADDVPGTPLYDGPYPTVDVTRPVVFRRLSYTRYQGRVLLQLNYAVWFRARPAAGRFDLYAGRLDGVNWRVTLAPDGHPLLYDTIHHCGCYHMLFPTGRLRLRSDIPGEPPLVPQTLADTVERPTIHLQSGTHYIRRVTFGAHGPEVAAERYGWDDAYRLTMLPTGDGGRRSLFGRHGIVPGTRRAERFLLWPMGIRSPGAMRQWGRHATAFVGRRHFDDAHLIEKLFVPEREVE